MNSKMEAIWGDSQIKRVSQYDARHPYYIAAPYWVHSSAGIRALYLLCHSLNRVGLDAYITNHPHGEYEEFAPWTNTQLMAPMLSKKVARKHFRLGLSPIMIYPETILGNPLMAPVVARWVMNFPGLLGGDISYEPNEICFGYSRELAMAAGKPEQVLHLPAVDTRIFYPPGQEAKRQGGCFCASKYKAVHQGDLSPVTEGCFEITRQLPDSLKPEGVADLFRKSEVFYTYENTALAIEAVLCGCPAVFIPNPHLTGIIGRKELGTDGYAWGMDPEEIERARATVTQGACNYLKTFDLFWEQLDGFINITQERASGTSYTQMIAIPSWPPTGWQRQMGRIGKELRRFSRRLNRGFGLSKTDLSPK